MPIFLYLFYTNSREDPFEWFMAFLLFIIIVTYYRPPSTPGSGISLGARQNNSQINPSPPSSDQSNEGDGAVSASPNLQLKKELNTPSEPPPPPPSTDPDDCVAADAESQRDAEKKVHSLSFC